MTVHYDKTPSDDFKALPDSVHPLLQMEGVGEFVRSIEESDVPLFVRLIGMTEVTSLESASSLAKNETAPETQPSRNGEGTGA